VSVEAAAKLALAHDVKRLAVAAYFCLVDGLAFRAEGNVGTFTLYEIVL